MDSQKSVSLPSYTERSVLFAGSFHPFTIGHEAMVKRGLALFDKVVVGFGYNDMKGPRPGMEEELSKVRRHYESEPRVVVTSYTGLTAEAARRLGCEALLRGVRDASDFDYERKLADINREALGIDTVILVADASTSYVSSSMVRELAANGRDISPFVI